MTGEDTECCNRGDGMATIVCPLVEDTIVGTELVLAVRRVLLKLNREARKIKKRR